MERIFRLNFIFYLVIPVSNKISMNQETREPLSDISELIHSISYPPSSIFDIHTQLSSPIKPPPTNASEFLITPTHTDTEIQFYNEQQNIDTNIHVSTASPLQPCQSDTERRSEEPSTSSQSQVVPETFHIFREDGHKIFVKDKVNHRQELDVSDSSKRGKRCKEACSGSVARSKSRRNHLDGFYKKMRDLYIRTGDEILIEHHKNLMTKSKSSENPIVRYATTMKLFGKNTQHDEDDNHDYPTLKELAAGSPSKSQRKRKKAICPLCGIEESSKRDEKWNSNWIWWCHDNCKVGQHVKCMGLIFQREVKSVKWTCPLHTPNPPPPEATKYKKK